MLASACKARSEGLVLCRCEQDWIAQSLSDGSARVLVSSLTAWNKWVLEPVEQSFSLLLRGTVNCEQCLLSFHGASQ